MERRISKLSGHVIICGHGRVGAAAAKHFYGNGCPFVVIEQLEEQVKELRALGFHVLEGDGTREESLLRANIKSAESLLAVMDSDPENLFAVLTARELNPMLHIIARTDDPSSESRMLRAGADSIISPFISAGKSVAESLMKAKNVIEKEAWAKDYDGARLHWVEVRADSDLCGLTIAEAKQKVGSDIIGVRSDGKDQLMPGGDYVLYAQDELLLSANGENPVIVDATPKKIGFIDDNPVILRLYTRLFQKAGFTVVSAVTGAEGLEMVDNHDLDCLIVDYHLPDMTGVDVCEKLHKSSEGDGVKTFIFTADNQEQIKTVASTVGVDKVVIKSADAGEIVSLVSSELL